MINPAALCAVTRRQLSDFLVNPVGYIFILVFVVVTGAISFLPEEFYKTNITDLGKTLDYMPILLAVLLPALSMGAWTQEKENGTDELLLTLPVNAADVVLGKLAAITSFFTIALLCNLSNLVVLMVLGDPDIGLVLSNYVAWWFCGLIFAAASLLASVQAGSAVIAFVLGFIYCAALVGIGDVIDWMEPFQRGVVSFGGVLIAIGVAVVGVALSIIWLASQRWRADRGGNTVVQIINVILAVVIAVNCGRWAMRSYWDVDVSSDGISSIGEASKDILGNLEHQVRLDVFVNADIPSDPTEMALKAREVLDVVQAIKRNANGKVVVRIHRPEDALDEIGRRAQEHYNINPRQVVAETVMGKDVIDMFLGATISSGGYSQRVDYFEPGLSVEYELIRCIRTIDGRVEEKLPVLGVLKTEISMAESMDFQTGQTKPAWQVVKEWERQYDIQEVQPDMPIPESISVLVVPLVSGLTQEEMVHVHDYIWAGRPTLLLCDPYPWLQIQSGNMIAPSWERVQPQQSPGMQPPPAPEKGKVEELFTALGVAMEKKESLWSNYRPTANFAGMPKGFIWSSNSEDGGIHKHTITNGMQWLLTLYPGAIRPLQNTTVEVTPIIGMPENATWGVKPLDDYIMKIPGYGAFPNQQRMEIYEPVYGKQPSLAVSITGTMKRAWDSAAVAEGESDIGKASAQSINVIMMADLDMVDDQFYGIYRGIDARHSRKEQKLWGGIRNVQLLANAVDFLAGDDTLVSLRSRRPQHRTQLWFEKDFAVTEEEVAKVRDEARLAKEAKLAKAQERYQAALDAIQKRTDLDAQSRKQLEAAKKISEQRVVDIENRQADREEQREIRMALRAQRSETQSKRTVFKVMAIGIPALVLLLFTLFVAITRVLKERSDIPAARARVQAGFDKKGGQK